MSSPTLRVIVDDSIGDPSILKYDGSWSPGSGKDGEHNKTTQVTRSQGSSITFNFYGSAVRLVGTLVNGDGTVNLSRSIDSGRPTTTSSKEDPRIMNFHHSFFQEDVPDGGHSLLTTLEGNDTMLSFDYFIFNTTLDNYIRQQKSLMVLVDDNETERIIYKNQWMPSQSRPFTMDQTEHITRLPGSTATFKFQGTYVAVYGTLFANRATSTWQLDNGAIENYISPSGSTTCYKLFERSVADGEHTLVITSTSNSEFSLDYITYLPSLSAAASSSSSSSSGTNKTPAIVGGVVGGVVGLLAIVLLAVFLIRKRRKASTPQATHVLPAHAPFPANHVTPFLGETSTVPTGFLASSTGSQWSAPSRVMPQHEQDGGVRVVSGGWEEASRPPVYQPDYLTTTVKNW